MERIDLIWSLESKLKIESICSIRILSILEVIAKIAKCSTLSSAAMNLPSKNGMSCLVDLILESGNVLNVLELIHQLISQFQTLEKFWKKLKSTGNPDEMKNNAIIYNTHVQARVEHFGSSGKLVFAITS